MHCLPIFFVEQNNVHLKNTSLSFAGIHFFCEYCIPVPGKTIA